MNTLLRQIPQIEVLLASPALAGLVEEAGREPVTGVLRAALDKVRKDVLAGHLAALPDFEGAAFTEGLKASLARLRPAGFARLINATGILIHTNLGRARLAPEALAAVRLAGESAIDLEFDTAAGERGSRYASVEPLLCALTGAEAALVVNNCASAILLGLMVTAAGRKVIASRGELIEIGGGYRLPDIIEESGAVLKEVGATNRTYLSDYEAAIDPDAAVLLKSHTSNYRITGFTHTPQRTELAGLARRAGLVLMEDLGSGALVDLAPYGLSDEPVVRTVLAAGVDLVMFSGDKLLGGPQCGILAGRRDLIAVLRRHPLCRAVRINKLSLAALGATLRLYLPPHDPLAEVPVLAAITRPPASLEAEARRLAASLHAAGLARAEVIASEAYVGGGAMPQQPLPSFAVAIDPGADGAHVLAGALRRGSPGLVGRIEAGRLLIDMRSLAPGEADEIPSLFAGRGAP